MNQLKRSRSTLVILLFLAIIMGFGTFYIKTDAADIAPMRGAVCVDLDDFMIAGRTSSKSGLVKDKDSEKYVLHYKNSFTDRNHLGITCRSNQAFDMTDVTELNVAVNSMQDTRDKFLFYIDSGADTTYHKMDDTDIHSSTVSGRGNVVSLSYLVDRITGVIFSKSMSKISAPITPRNGSAYVYIALSHEWQVHDAKISLDNQSETHNKQGNFEHGSISLTLKKHNITLLQPDYPTQIMEDGTEKQYVAFSNLRMCLNDGKEYETGKTGDIYKDEKFTLKYALADAGNCKLSGYRFYQDQKRTTLLYTKNVESGESESSFTFDAKLIQKLEEKIGTGNLGSVYVEPVFSQKEVTIDFSSVVPEQSNYLEVVKGSDANTFLLRETNNSKALIGTFEKNKASHIGDVITFKYHENPDYDGDYHFQYYEIRICEGVNQVNGTYPIEAQVSDHSYDISQKLDHTYYWIQAHTRLQAELKLQDKSVVFNNHAVSIENAEVIYPEGQSAPTGKITYQYYTNSNCSEADQMKELPVNAGTYYVVATMAQDQRYNTVKSAPASLVIKKAVPTLSNLRGEEITYGNDLTESVIYGKATGVTKSTITGTYQWKDSHLKPEAGTNKLEVVFTPSAQYEKNYQDAEGMATISVRQVVPIIEGPQSNMVVYTGEMVGLDGASVKGIDAQTGAYISTNQKLQYEYYPNEFCRSEERLDDMPTEAGEYYVLVSVAAQGNYAYTRMKVSDAAKLTIQPRHSQLIQIPVDIQVEEEQKREYRVYVSNVAKGLPQGTVDISVSTDEGIKGKVSGLSISQDESGYSYASFFYENVQNLLGDATNFDVVAEYQSLEKDNYEIDPNTFHMGDGRIALQKQVTLTFGGLDATCNIADDFPEQGIPDDVTINWNVEKVNAGNVVEVSAYESGKKLTIKPKNAGKDIISAYLTSGEETWYLSYGITVDKANQNVTVEKPADDLIYNGLPQTYSVFAEMGNEITNVTQTAKITYVQTENGAYTGNLPPVDAGRYQMQIQVEGNSNYLPCTLSYDSMIINRATPQIQIYSKETEYDGDAQQLEPEVITGIAGGTEVTGEVSYHYQGTDVAYDSYEAPTHVGTYQIYAHLAADGNYLEASSQAATLRIQPTACSIEIKEKFAEYSGQPIQLDQFEIHGVKDEVLNQDVEIYYRKSAQIDSSLVSQSDFIREPVDAGIYYGWGIIRASGDYKGALSPRTILAIEKNSVTVSLEDTSVSYSGNKAIVTPAVVTSSDGINVTQDSEITYRYYADEKGTEEIAQPQDAGVYYVRAISKERDNYKQAQSEIRKLVIAKADVQLDHLSASTLVYGQKIRQSNISGRAIGVLGESVEGSFVLDDEATYETLDAGSYTVGVLFIPEANQAVNYNTATSETNLVVDRYTPEILANDISVVYDGEAHRLPEVRIQGAPGMPCTDGEISYQYYYDSHCENEIENSQNGVTAVGEYFCKVIVQETNNYNKAESVKLLTIEKSTAAIQLQVQQLDKEMSTLILQGTLQGVIDDPTGSVNLFMKSHNEQAYTAISHDCKITQLQTGEYGFVSEAIPIGLNDNYDFKAEYVEGNAQNYTVHDGELLEVNTAKDPQTIYFREHKIEKAYGCKPFTLQVEDAGNGSKEVSYQLISKVSDADVLDVTPEGLVTVKGVGTTFCLAVKPEDATHNPAYAIVCIRVNKSNVIIESEDQSVVYSDQEVSINSPTYATEFGEITENIPSDIIYFDQTQNPIIGLPVNAGMYSVWIYTKETEHYCAQHKNITLTILPYEPKIVMEDHTVTYDGKSHQVGPVQVQGVQDEMLTDDQVIEEYFRDADCTEQILDWKGNLVNSGTYYDRVSVKNQENYQDCDKVSTLTIEKAKAAIQLGVDSKQLGNSTVWIQGVLANVFDDPTGSITIYRRESGEQKNPDVQKDYEIVAENIAISGLDERYGFQAMVPVTPGHTYDFVAKYIEGNKRNYQISDDTLIGVEVKTGDVKKEDVDKIISLKTGDSLDIKRMILWSLLCLSSAGVLGLECRKRKK